MRGENRESGLREAAGGHEMSEPTLQETKNHKSNKWRFTSEMVNGILRIRKVPLVPTDRPPSPETSLVPAYGGEDDREARASNTLRELWERTQLGEGDRHQARRQAEQLIKDATASDAIKEDWIRLIHAEGILASEVTAFIPRVQGEETNPTFEHPEDWDSLSLQEKAHLILANKAVKLMGLLC